MNIQNLIKMANQIGAFFEAMPDRPQATADIAAHIKRFWDPRMRHQLLSQMDSQVTANLKEIVRDALRTHRHSLE